ARRQRGCRLPAGDLDRIVPGADAHTHAQWFAPGVGEGVFEWVLRASQRGGGTGKVFDAIGAAGDIDNMGLLPRFTGVLYLKCGELKVARPQQLRRTVQDAATLSAGHGRPNSEATVGGLDGGAYVGLGRFIHPGDYGARGGGEGAEALSAGLQRLAIDKTGDHGFLHEGVLL